MPDWSDALFAVSGPLPAFAMTAPPNHSTSRLPEGFPVKQAIIQSAGQAPAPLDIGGFQITVLASSEQTGGYELFRIRGPEGTGPGPHHHPWDESFFVLGGAVRCGVGEEEVLATTGTLIHVPGGTTHWFRFAEGGGEFFSMTSAGNASTMFKAFGRGINWADPDRTALTALAASYGQVVAGTPG